MNRKQTIEGAFNYCSTLNYDEEIVDITQQEVDSLLDTEKILGIKKVKIDDRRSVLTMCDSPSIISSLFGIKR